MEAKKATLGIFLGFCLITTLESYAMSHFSGENPGKPQIRNNGATITDHQLKMLCAFNKMIEAGKMEEREEARELHNAHS